MHCFTFLPQHSHLPNKRFPISQMKHLIFFYSLLVTQLPSLYGQAEAPAPWNLNKAFQASSHIFYGSLNKSIPEPNFKTGVMGVRIQEIKGAELVMKEIIWTKAKELSFTVTEPFKGDLETEFIAFQHDPDMDVWTHVANDTGDVFLAQPKAVDPLLKKLYPEDSGLFYIRHYFGSNIPIIYRVRQGQKAIDDLAILRAYKAANGEIPLEAIQKKTQLAELAKVQREAEEFKVFEDDYYKILRIQDLDIRTSLLKDLVLRMGFEGRWEYFKFKERYMELHGTHLEPGAIPSGPSEGKERIWHNISDELRKIEVIQKVRASKK